MSESKVAYSLNHETNHATLETDLDIVRVQLEEIERRLIPLLVTVQRALGKEPSISTRAERYRR